MAQTRQHSITKYVSNTKDKQKNPLTKVPALKDMTCKRLKNEVIQYRAAAPSAVATSVPSKNLLNACKRNELRDSHNHSVLVFLSGYSDAVSTAKVQIQDWAAAESSRVREGVYLEASCRESLEILKLLLQHLGCVIILLEIHKASPLERGVRQAVQILNINSVRMQQLLAFMKATEGGLCALLSPHLKNDGKWLLAQGSSSRK